MAEPFISIEYDSKQLDVEFLDYDPTDDYQPYLFLLPDGETVWIPVDDLSDSNRAELADWVKIG